MASTTPEGKFKNDLRDGLKSSYKRCYFDKIVQGPRTGSGRPDLEVCGSNHGVGLDVHIETKVGSNKPSVEQKYVMSEICKGGGIAVWARLNKKGEVHWYDAAGTEFKVTTSPADCVGILECCRDHINKTILEGIWDEFNAIEQGL